MSVQVRRRRESAAFLASFVGAQGELLVDTTNNRVQVHDGATPGGWPAAKLADVAQRTAVADANYFAAVSDRTVGFTALTAARTVALPAASAYPTGTALTVVDESGACSATLAITIAAAGSDTVNGAATAKISSAYGYLALASNGTGKWTIIDAPGAAGGGSGSAGATGATGAAGPGGTTGSTGATGPTGPQGLTGATGAQGIAGATGSTGATGQAGATGAAGSSVNIKGSVATSSALPGSGASLGDGYITSDTGHLWVYSNATAGGSVNGFTDVGLVRGPAGAQGATGANGPAGQQGASGIAGATGATGPAGAGGVQGTTGATGAAGGIGATGATGPQGNAGPAGPTGTTGATGTQGATGPSGPAGATGPQGATGAAASNPVTSVAARTGAVTLAVADVSGAAPLASPALTGTPTAPNAAAGTNSSQVATTSFVAASFVTYAYGGQNYATASNATLTGTPTAPTQAPKDNSTRLATTAYADGAVAATIARTQVNDAAYTALPTDRTIAYITLSAARTVTLPAASAFPGGVVLTIVDETGSCSPTVAITIAAAGSDLVNGAATAILAMAYGYVALESNTSNKWTQVDFGGAGIATTAQLTNRNAIIDGNFVVNQRAYASGSALAANVYAHDRWKSGSGGCTYAFSQGVPDTTISISAGSLVQVVEATAVAVPSWWLTWTGTAQARVWQGSASGSYAAGTAMTINGVQVNALLVTGLAVGTATAVEFSGGTLGLVQLEAALPNAGPTRFERRPIGQELALCQRYFRLVGSAYVSCAGTGLWNSTTQARIGLTWRGVTMRAAPTFTLVGSAGAWTVDAQGTSINLSSLTLLGADAESATVLAGIPSSGVQGVQSQGTMMMGSNSSGTMTFSAEL